MRRGLPDLPHPAPPDHLLPVHPSQLPGGHSFPPGGAGGAPQFSPTDGHASAGHASVPDVLGHLIASGVLTPNSAATTGSPSHAHAPGPRSLATPVSANTSHAPSGRPTAATATTPSNTAAATARPQRSPEPAASASASASPPASPSRPRTSSSASGSGVGHGTPVYSPARPTPPVAARGAPAPPSGHGDAAVSAERRQLKLGGQHAAAPPARELFCVMCGFTGPPGTKFCGRCGAPSGFVAARANAAGGSHTHAGIAAVPPESRTATGGAAPGSRAVSKPPKAATPRQLAASPASVASASGGQHVPRFPDRPEAVAGGDGSIHGYLMLWKGETSALCLWCVSCCVGRRSRACLCTWLSCLLLFCVA